MNKRIVAYIIISLALIIGVGVFAWFRFLYTPDYPEGTLYESHTYKFDPLIVLAALDQGATGMFQPAPQEPQGGWSQLWPPGSFAWNQKDYLKIADALHYLVWNESLAGWHLIRASFDIRQCRDVFDRIDSADFSFYQRSGGYNTVHGLSVMPLYGLARAGNEYSPYSPWTAQWQIIDLNKVKINSVDAALLVAEENGGRDARLSVKNECRITLLLAPDRLEYDFLSHPFTHYDWGWSVIYWPNVSNADSLFSITIDPYTGEYEFPMNK